MTTEEAIKDITEIFSKPSEFSVKNPNISHMFAKNDFIVSKQWGYLVAVIITLRKYFNDNGNISDGGIVITGSNDLLGTEVMILNKEEYADVKKYKADHDNNIDLISAYHIIKKY